MKKKAICTIMILMLVVTPCYRAYADAGTIAITGGSIAVGGAGTIATGAIAGPVVVAVFCGMMAMGMNVSLTNASQQAGMTKTQYIKSKLEQYCNEAQITYGVFNNAILNGTTILTNGAIKLGSQAGAQIKQFCNWLWNTDQVTENTNVGTNDTVELDNLSCPYGVSYTYNEPNGFTTIENVNNKKMAFVALPAGDYVHASCIIRAEDFTSVNDIVYKFNNNIFSYGNEYISNENYVLVYSTPSYQLNQYVQLPVVNNARAFIDSLSPDAMDAPQVNDGFTGERDTYNDRSTSLDTSPGQSTVINPGLTGSIPVPADTDITINIRDYLDALEKVLDGIQAGIVARDKETDIPFTIPIPDETVLDPTIDKDDDQDLPDSDDQTPVTDPDKPVDPEQNPSTSVNPLKFDLKNIFPFCIPFDIKDMLAKLNAEPVAPNYHVDWNIPLLNTSLEFDINLACWNSVAAILRKMELLSFIVGLAVLTRNLIRG